MIPSPSLPWYELARFRRSRLTRVAVVAVSIVPLLYGALYIWANINPTGNLDKVTAAIVNDDEIVELTDADGNEQPVAIGRLLSANLIGNDDANNYDWRLTDAKDAYAGLADGRYKAVLYIPKNLSAAATSTSGDPSEAIQGELDLQTNDAVNYINGTIAQTILKAAKDSLNAQVTETYLDNIYLGFSDIRLALNEAADGAGQLGDGASQLANGAHELTDGAGQLADGTHKLDDGASQLAGGTSTLKKETSSLPSDTRQLADGARQVADGTSQFNAVIQQVTTAILDATADADNSIDELAAQLDQVADACEANPPDGVDCSVLRQVAANADELKSTVGGVRDDIDQVRNQSQQLADGADQVATANEQLAAGMPALTGAIAKLASGASQLADGTGQLADGADQLADGAGQLADGADQLADGAYKLQSGLVDGSQEIPDYTDEEREQLAKAAATPVEDAAQRLNEVNGYGSALAPYFMALALWVGGMAIYLLLRPFSARAIASTASSVRTALAGLAPGLAIAAVQAALLVAVVVWALGIEASRPTLLVGTALAAAITFTALNQMFIAVFGAAGRFVAIAFVCLQLTSAGGTYPIETSPGIFNTLHSLLPMTYVVDLFRAAIAGGPHALAGSFAVLAIFTLGALAITSIAAYRRQSVTISRLHPTLVV